MPWISRLPPGSPKFLRSLKRNNRREWFQPRKHLYEQHVKAPMLELVSALNAGLQRFAPDYVTDPAKAVFRIYRDTRFSADKTPYKTHVAASFSRRGPERLKTGGFYFSVAPDQIEVAGGIYHPEPDTMLLIRTHIAETPQGAAADSGQPENARASGPTARRRTDTRAQRLRPCASGASPGSR